MRHVALALLLVFIRRGAAAAQVVPPQNSQPARDRQDRHDPGARATCLIPERSS